MNREKEILLALLLEKYAEPKVINTVPHAMTGKGRGTRTKTSRSSTMWSQEELRAMVRLVNSRQSFEFIAKQLNRSVQGVYAMFLQINSSHVMSKNPTVLNHRIQTDPQLIIESLES